MAPPWRRTRAEDISDARMLHRESRRTDPSLWSATSPWGIVATSHYRATAAGREVLERGGNAVDGAVASALALGVVEPSGSGLGGMAMMLVHLAGSGRTLAIEGPCRAPSSATPELVAAGPRRRGYRAVAVPSNPAVLGWALERYGRLSRQEVLAPAITLAEDGYAVTPLDARLAREYIRPLRAGNAARLVLGPDGNLAEAGAVRRQPELAGTLERLATSGFEDFYTGRVGEAIVKDMERNGGFIRRRDLEEIPWPVETEPLEGSFDGMQVRTLHPPGGGTALVEMLHIHDEIVASGLDPDPDEAAVLMAAIIRRARLDRRRFPSGLASEEGTDGLPLTSREHAARAASEILEFIADRGAPVRSRHEAMRDSAGGETTHVCVMDARGNVASLTQSIERSFGAAVATPGLGFLYNGYMRTFKVKSRNHPFTLRPGAAARSNASPTILLGPDGRRIAVGSTGSERMGSSIFQVLVQLRARDPFSAVSAPRLHCTPEGQVFLEADRFSPATLLALEDRGFTLSAWDAWSFKAGGLQLAITDGSHFRGVAEPRRDGAAAGPRTQPRERVPDTQNRNGNEPQ